MLSHAVKFFFHIIFVGFSVSVTMSRAAQHSEKIVNVLFVKLICFRIEQPVAL